MHTPDRFPLFIPLSVHFPYKQTCPEHFIDCELPTAPNPEIFFLGSSLPLPCSIQNVAGKRRSCCADQMRQRFWKSCSFPPSDPRGGPGLEHLCWFCEREQNTLPLWVSVSSSVETGMIILVPKGCREGPKEVRWCRPHTRERSFLGPETHFCWHYSIRVS